MKNAVLSLLMVVVGLSHATPGKLDARGCHNSQKIGHHCHAARESVGASGESSRERDKRLKRECKGRANSGLCSGYGS